MKKNIRRQKKQEDRKVKTRILKLVLSAHLLVFLSAGTEKVSALEPAQILIIANSDVNESLQLAQYYCNKRNVPAENVVKVPLGADLSEKMSRQDYDNILAPAIRNKLVANKPQGIRCLLTLYGVPIKVGPAKPDEKLQKLIPDLRQILNLKHKKFEQLYHQLNALGRKELVESNTAVAKSYDDILKTLDRDIKQAVKRIEYIDDYQLRQQQYEKLVLLVRDLYGPAYAARQAEQLKLPFRLSADEQRESQQASTTLHLAQQEDWTINKKIQNNFYQLCETVGGLTYAISNLKADIDRCSGAETGASVDSELSMILYDRYDLYRWQRNDLKGMPLWLPAKTLMVSRLDGPSVQIAAGLIDKAIAAEANGLEGAAYIDLRGLNIVEPEPYSLEFFDRSLFELANMLKKRTTMNVVVENTASLFTPDCCPDAAIYCGWYSLRKYINSFGFSVGAIGFHIASLEAMDLRNPASSNWCPAMLSKGITATLGAVDEPYLHSFPLPDEFFRELLDGKCLVEAFYRTNPFNSWQLVLIGDPLYKIKVKLRF